MYKVLIYLICFYLPSLLVSNIAFGQETNCSIYQTNKGTVCYKVIRSKEMLYNDSSTIYEVEKDSFISNNIVMKYEDYGCKQNYYLTDFKKNKLRRKDKRLIINEKFDEFSDTTDVFDLFRQLPFIPTYRRKPSYSKNKSRVRYHCQIPYKGEEWSATIILNNNIIIYVKFFTDETIRQGDKTYYLSKNIEFQSIYFKLE